MFKVLIMSFFVQAKNDIRMSLDTMQLGIHSETAVDDVNFVADHMIFPRVSTTNTKIAKISSNVYKTALWYCIYGVTMKA